MDYNGNTAYYIFWLLIVFTSGIPISEGFISLVSALKIFKAPIWRVSSTTKLINNYNIEALVKYKKLKAAKHFSFLNRIIMGLKKCSFLIAKALIICRIGED